MEIAIKKHIGNLRIESKKDAKKYADITEITGSLYVNADFQAPVLTSVGGYLYVNADFQAPVLTSVGGYLDVRADFQAPVLTSVGGSLYVNADFQAPVLTSVGGSLYVNADFQAPVLTSVGGYLDVRADFQAPVLTSVGGYLDVRADCEFSAPLLAIAYGVKGRLIAIHKYGLWLSEDYKYYAGCKGPMTKNQAIALSKVYDDQETAQIFIAAILADEALRNTVET